MAAAKGQLVTASGQRRPRRVLESFVEQYQQLVFLCCRTLGLRESEAEDVASETFFGRLSKT